MAAVLSIHPRAGRAASRERHVSFRTWTSDAGLDQGCRGVQIWRTFLRVSALFWLHGGCGWRVGPLLSEMIRKIRAAFVAQQVVKHGMFMAFLVRNCRLYKVRYGLYSGPSDTLPIPIE